MPVTVLFFLAGILCVQQLAALPAMEWLLVILIVAAFLGWRKYWRMTAVFLGIFWAILNAAFQLEDRLPERLAGQDRAIQGYIADLPEVNPDHVRFNFKIISPPPDIPGLVRLTWYHPEQVLKAGQTWRLTVRLKPPHGNFNPGGFDYERWLFVERIGATGYVRAAPRPELLTAVPAVSLTLLTWRQQLADRIDELKVNPESLGMIKALTLGEGNGLSARQWEVFRRTGTTHLMVISGSHVALVAGLMYLLTLKACSRFGRAIWPPQRLAAVAAMLTAFTYAGLTGFAVPAQRAAFMLTIAMLALIQQRHMQAFQTLGIALLTVLLIDPLIVLLPGFWLSFLAVSLIIYALSGRLKKSGWMIGAIKINWATSLGLAPLILYFFQQVSLIAPVANLIAVPLVGLLLVPMSLCAVLLLLTLPWLGEQLFEVIDRGLQGLWWLLVNLAELPAATLTQVQPGWWALALAVPAVLLLLAPKGMPSRWLGVVMLLPIIVTYSEKPPSGQAKLTLLDVGQGLSAIVQTASHVLVYDTGAKFSETSDAGQSIVIPYLRSQGITKVDALIISHGDNDHVGGANSLLKQYKIDQFLTSVPQLFSGAKQCQAGQSWQWDGVGFTVLSPKLGTLLSDNDNSCVLRILAVGSAILLTGDIEAQAEMQLVNHYARALSSEILVAPHHGSNTSSSRAFIQAVNPELILIPAGYRNQFGHPHEQVLEKYKALAKPWLISAGTGALQVNTTSPGQAQSWRISQGRYWNYQP